MTERYSEAGQPDRDAVIADRPKKLERSQRRLQEPKEISAEAHALFVRMWLTNTPQGAARATKCRSSRRAKERRPITRAIGNTNRARSEQT